MTIKVAINGYGRIGRNVLRAFYEGGKKQDIQIVAINDLGDAKSNAHLTRYDTAHGKFPGTVTVEGDNMIAIDDHVVAFDGDRARELAVRGVVAGQVGVRFGIAQVVDGNDLDILFLAAFVESAQYITADAAVAIDCNFDRHTLLLIKKEGTCTPPASTSPGQLKINISRR